MRTIKTASQEIANAFKIPPENQMSKINERCQIANCGASNSSSGSSDEEKLKTVENANKRSCNASNSCAVVNKAHTPTHTHHRAYTTPRHPHAGTLPLNPPEEERSLCRVDGLKVSHANR